jgi:hypothetical protein
MKYDHQPTTETTMSIRNRIEKVHRTRAGCVRTKEGSKSSAAEMAERTVPEIYQVVVECRHEREQQAVFERMRAEGYRCRVLTL